MDQVPFFLSLDRIQKADPEYQKAFDDELKAFKERIRRRAKEKVDEQMAELRAEEEAEREARLGPGGLDPMEVFESLPAVMNEKYQKTGLNFSYNIGHHSFFRS